MNDIYKEKEKLYYQSKNLKKINFDIKSIEKQREIRQMQNEVYKKYNFYKEFLKVKEK